MRIRCKLPILLLCLSHLALAQSRISGTITDGETGQSVPFAHVFVSNTTIGTVSDVNGKFQLVNVPPEQCQFIASFVGYEDYVLTLPSNRTNLTLQIKLKAKAETLEALTFSETLDKEWQRNLKAFKREFFGRTANASSCEIVNPWVLNFSKKGPVFRADASEPLQILNRALGYEISFHLNRFDYSGVGYTIIGPVRFHALADQHEYKTAREQAFEGSSKHFLKLLITDQFKEHGFKIYRSVNAIEEQQRTRRFYESFSGMQELAAADIMRPGDNGTLELHSTRPVEVHYEPGRDFEPSYQDIIHQVSWIQSRTGIIQIDSSGNILNQHDVTVSGYWNRLRVAELLPLDYDPGAIGDSPDESIMLVTDKSIFSGKSPVWYTVLTTGFSTTVYTQLLDSLGKNISSRVDRISQGKTSGNFTLPDSPGRYYLRAYTPAAFASGNYFLKPLLVVQDDTALLACDDIDSDVSLSYKLDSLDQKTRLGLKMLDHTEDTMEGEFTLAIAPVGTDCDCLNGEVITFQKRDNNITATDGTRKGTVKDKKGRPINGRLVLFTSDLSFSTERLIAEDGSFQLYDIVFYDSSTWLAQVYDKKERAVKDFEIVVDEMITPTVQEFRPLQVLCSWLSKNVDSLVTEIKPRANQGVVNDELKLSDSTRLLSEVVVSGSRIQQRSTPQPTFRSHGQPQYIFKGKDLINNPTGTNILNTIAGRVPGMTIAEGNNNFGGGKTKIKTRGIGTPIVILDGMPITDLDLAYDILQTIPLTDVDRIEVRASVSPMLGLNGSGGFIAVYTKRAGSSQVEDTTPPSLKKLKIDGYSPTPTFAPDSTKLSTYYWNAHVPFGDNPVYADPGWLSEQFTVSVSGISSSGEIILIREKISLAAPSDR